MLIVDAFNQACGGADQTSVRSYLLSPCLFSVVATNCTGTPQGFVVVSLCSSHTELIQGVILTCAKSRNSLMSRYDGYEIDRRDRLGTRCQPSVIGVLPTATF